jgi:hypothetical protein
VPFKMKTMLLTFLGLLVLGVQVHRDRPVEGHLKVDDPAPEFRLKRLGQPEWFSLSSNVGKRPTFLIFGSYT